jgi:hypothetical protein
MPFSSFLAFQPSLSRAENYKSHQNRVEEKADAIASHVKLIIVSDSPKHVKGKTRPNHYYQRGRWERSAAPHDLTYEGGDGGTLQKQHASPSSEICDSFVHAIFLPG